MPLIPHKAWLALIVVAIALTGVFTGMKWLTIAALVLWILSMLVFGTGRRGKERE